MPVLKKFDSQLPHQFQKNRLPWWLIRLLLIGSLVMPPTLVAAFSKEPVFIHFKLWNIEYQFQKGNIVQPREEHFEQQQLELEKKVAQQ